MTKPRMTMGFTCVAVILLSIGGCNNVATNNSSNNTQKPLLPLDVGNVWAGINVNYRADGTERTRVGDTLTVLRDTVIADVRWSRLSNFSLVRQANGGVYAFGFPIGTKGSVLLYKDPASVGDRYAAHIGSGTADSAITVVTHTSEDVSVYGRHFQCHVYTRTIPTLGIEDVVYIARGVGFIKMVHNSFGIDGARTVISVWELQQESLVGA